MMRWLTATLLSLMCVQVQAVTPEFVAHYNTKKYGIGGGITEISLKEQDGKWHYRSLTKPRGLASLFVGDKSLERHAVLKLEGERLIPLESHSVQKNSKKDRDQHYFFDWKKRKVTGVVRGEEISLPLNNGETDVFSLELDLIQDVATGAEDFTYQVYDKGELKVYEYQRLPREAVQTDYGLVEVIPLQRKKGNSKNTTYTIWFAPQFNYLPVKFDKSEKGKSVLELELESVEWEASSDA